MNKEHHLVGRLRFGLVCSLLLVTFSIGCGGDDADVFGVEEGECPPGWTRTAITQDDGTTRWTCSMSG